MKNKVNLLTLIALGGILLAFCAGCGKDASEQAEVNALPKNPASTPKPIAGGGSVGGAPAVAVPHQDRPDGN